MELSLLTWTYQTFRVAGPEDKYRLTIGGGEGTGNDAMAYHNDQQFTTYDMDNDQINANCGIGHQGGWWYNACYIAHLNGPHTTPTDDGVDQRYARLQWNDGTGLRDVLSSEMKIRVKQCKI